MRRTGFVDAVEGLSSHDHICWVFDTSEEFRAAAGRFLADGLAGGQRVLFSAEWAVDGDLDRVDGFAAARGDGAAQVQRLGGYGGAAVIDPATQVRVYAEATGQALADGFTGLRVAADATPLVASAAALAAFARYEFLIDGFMARHPMSAMCGYNRRELGKHAVAELAGMHPLAPPSSTPLRLYAADPDTSTAAAALAGEVDMAGYEQLRTALDRVQLTAAGGTVTIDARELTFIDHQGLTYLVDHVRGRGATTELVVGRRSLVPMLAGLLGRDDLRVVVS
jgi:hypothetical protein